MVMMIRKAFVLVLFSCVCCLSVVVFLAVFELYSVALQPSPL